MVLFILYRLIRFVIINHDFKFQYGAIYIEISLPANQIQYALNSSMVLFILSRPSRVSPSLATLNSSMVLFILIGANKKEDGYYIFKFQYGAIYIDQSKSRIWVST